MLQRRNPWRYVPTLDTLEARWVPDGSVSAALKNGVLTLIGDLSANQIEISGTGGKITVSSLDGVTKLNGATNDLSFTGVKGLSINLGAGDNVATIADLNFAKDLSITSNGGADTLTISDSTVGGVSINTGAGNDTVTLDNVTSGGQSTINTNGGLDTLTITSSTFNKQTTIDTGADADEVTLTDSTFSKEFKVITGAGADTVMIEGAEMLKQTQITTGSEGDSITILDTAFSKEVSLSAGTGDDEIFLNDSVFSKMAHIDGGPGADVLSFAGNTFEKQMKTTGIETKSTALEPTAGNDAVTLAEGGVAIINVAGNDTAAAGRTLNLGSIVITTPPTNGSVVVNADGTVTYTHNGSDTTADSFQYTIKDDLGEVSAPATVAVTITPVNDAPITAADAFSVLQGSLTVLNVLANDSDSDGTLNVGTVAITQQPAHGTVTVNADGTVSYQHDNTATTADSFSYTVMDSNGLVSSSTLVTLTIALV